VAYGGWQHRSRRRLARIASADRYQLYRAGSADLSRSYGSGTVAHCSGSGAGLALRHSALHALKSVSSLGKCR